MSGQRTFQTEVEALREQLVAWRRDFHQHPELGFEEHRSAGRIADHLRGLGYAVQTGVGRTGVVGLLEGASPGPVVMLRVDMDALPITEESGAAYASLTPGVMHACGHDAHMAIGLGVATLMARHRESVSGVLKLIFQPAEETPGGAEAMVRDGVLEDPRPDVFLGVHVWSNLPLGTIAAPTGPMMAAEDGWTCMVQGKGGHGAMPHQVVDPIVASAQMVTALQTVVSRNVDPLEAAVVSVGKIQGGGAFNVIPAEVELVGTIRTLAPEIRDTVVRRMHEMLQGVGAACGVEVALKIESGTPAVINAAEVAEVVRASAGVVVGAEKVLDAYRTMGSEDAAFFMQAVPGCYCLVGSANAERGLDAPHHNPRFDIDEDVLPLAVETLMGTLRHYLL